MEMLFIICLAFIIITIAYYNKLVKLSQKVEETKANIDVMYKQRFDTLPNLINTVKGYMNHEQETLVRITKLRTQLQSDTATEDEKTKANQELSKELPTLFALSENYPDLKANQHFLHLQKSIVNLEENLSAARRTYNAMVNRYNTYIQRFPALLFAKIFGYKKKELLYAKEDEKEKVKVGF